MSTQRLATFVLLSGASFAYQEQPLDHAACDTWNSIRASRLSRSGAWAHWEVDPDEGGDGTLHVRQTAGDTAYAIERGTGARLTADERFAVCLIAPSRDAVRAAEDEKTKPDERPKQGLAILDLESGERLDVERVRSFRLPEDAGSWVAYRLEPVKDKDEEREGKDAEEKDAGEEARKDKDKKDGSTLVVRDLASGTESRIDFVTSYAFTADGQHVVYATSTRAEGGDGLFVRHVVAEVSTPILEGEGDYRSIAIDEDSSQLAFLSNRDDYAGDEPAWTLYRAGIENEGSRIVARTGTPGIPADWIISEHRAPRFSKSGRRLLFGTAPRPEPEPEDLRKDDEVVLDLWSWTDSVLQSQQVVERERELERSYACIAHLEGEIRVVQLATLDVPDVSLADENDSAFALGRSNLAYRQRSSWDVWVPSDVWLIDVATGARERVLEESLGRHALSPRGRYVYWWQPDERSWYTLRTAGERVPVDASAGIPHPLHNERHDQPSLPRAHGSAGWLEDDAAFFVYDRFDLWRLDPDGRTSPSCETGGHGRQHDLRFRYVDLDAEVGGNATTIPKEREPLLLSAFDEKTKRSGFWHTSRLDVPVRLLMSSKRFSTPVRADEGDVLMFRRESYREFPDVWVAGIDLAGATKLSDANPHQASYRWGSAELFSWRSLDGEELQGIAYKPDDFDPNRAYPLLVYFYERLSDRLHSYHAPTPSRSSIRIPFYTSNDYVVFLPDIPYRIGYPGESCEAAILPAISKLIDTGFVDDGRIGIQGHSWGGYQIAHLVTRTDVFAAAVSGAPVSNMTSAYGGIRWGTGRSRMFQYEESQSRLGGTLWEVHNRFIVNSPLFFADRIATPLMMLHNDEDGAVPWYQGIELFVALRRLERPAWLLNYNGEGHGIGKYANKRDYAIRMRQFFDHYLRDAPAPEWMMRGIPAVRKGRTLGLDYVPSPSLTREEPQGAGAATPVGAGN
ncbi:MAG: S9 family peptidase [bacterium]|nr:S9 family peptidase [bacterium]